MEEPEKTSSVTFSGVCSGRKTEAFALFAMSFS
jgi:hypothetical protein